MKITSAKLTKQLISFLMVMLFLCVGQSTTDAQELSREVREKFETMLEELDTDLRNKFQTALDNNTSVVELTPRQLRKFRDNPVNPFDIDDIDPNQIDGTIELRFELPSLRNRPVQKYERQSRNLRRELRSSVFRAAKSAVAVYDDKIQIALGTVVKRNGYILSKASEVKKANRLRCETSNGRIFDAKIVATDYENDIALLKVDAENLIPVVWDNTQPTSGSFVVVPNPQGNVISLGTFSVIPRSTIGENHGFLGVAPQTVSEGVQIVDDIKYDTAAFEAGLKVGDIITNIDGKEVRETVELVDEIRKRQAGDKITIDFIRAGNRNRTVAKLAGQSLSATRAARFKMMSRLGAIPSSRNSDFPSVFQHDSPLFPEQCGGPICDLNGNVLGINIARESRAASYAIPSNKIEAVVDRLLLREVAFRKSISR